MKSHYIKFHSVVDLITNSSTELFTNSSKSVPIANELITELFKVLNIKESVEDVLDIRLTFNYDRMIDSVLYELSETDNEINKLESYQDKYDAILEIIEDIDAGKITDIPDWYIDSEEYRDPASVQSYVSITAKQPQYEKVAQLLVDLVYSVDISEQYN